MNALSLRRKLRWRNLAIVFPTPYRKSLATSGADVSGRYGVFNAIIFQACWFLCVLAEIHWAAVSVLLFLAIHLWVKQNHWRSELAAIALCAALGISIDQCLLWIGVLSPEGGNSLSIPYWLAVLWLAFSVALRGAFSWFNHRWITAGLIGLLAGPINYYIGANLNSTLDLGQPIITPIIALAALWALMFPGLIYLGDLIQRHCDERPADE